LMKKAIGGLAVHGEWRVLSDDWSSDGVIKAIALKIRDVQKDD